MATADINGTSIYFEEHSEGLPLLLMHGGLGLDHTYLKSSLGPLVSGRRAVYYDQRSNGRSGRPPLETLTMEQLADDAAALLDHLAIERAVVFGHSYGGFVAQELALRHPARIAGLILCDTTPGQLGAEEPANGEEQGPPPSPDVAALFSEDVNTDDELRSWLDRALWAYFHRFEPDAHPPYFRDTIVDVAALNFGMGLLGEWSTVDRLREITAPTLVLVGRHDVVTSWPQSMRITKRIPGATLHVFEESGHFPWMEEPGEFFSIVNQWLARLGASAVTA